MLDNLFNGILVFSILAMGAFASASEPVDIERGADVQVAQLGRVVVTGHSQGRAQGHYASHKAV